jgi:DNA (cytosine-5)-methyltransferase 1
MPDGSNFPRRRQRADQPAQWPLDAGITVVLFAGMGGACAGLEAAGCPVQVANNHDDVALAAHAALHPHTRHVRGDIFDVDPLDATAGRRGRAVCAGTSR